MPASASDPEPRRLSSHHRVTLEKIFRHPVSHNIEWNDVYSLLNAVADVREKRDGKFEVVLNGRNETIERPKHKDLDVQEVIDIRRLLEAAGYGPSPEG